MANTSTKSVNLKSFSVSIDEIKKIWRELNDLVSEQGEIEINRLTRLENHTEDDFNAYKERLRKEIFVILGTILWEDDSAIHTSDPELLSADGMLISEVYLSNITPYKLETKGVKPEHNFELLIDFKFPPLLDASTPVSHPTPNATFLRIEGTRSSWKAGVENIVHRHIRTRRPLRNWFHGNLIYDLFLMMAGLPSARSFPAIPECPLHHAISTFGLQRSKRSTFCHRPPSGICRLRFRESGLMRFHPLLRQISRQRWQPSIT